MKLKMNYSVLISVYKGENPDFLKKSLNSMFCQTMPSNDVVLVCDGKLTQALYKVIDNFKLEYPEVFRPVYLDKNAGTGAAANIGIKQCQNEIIVKMDSDDISHPDRCEKQLELFYNDPTLTMAGSYIQEFNSDTNENIAVKKTPLSHEDILKYARRRNPFNNQTLVFKKSFAEGIGGYSEVKRCEDYDFVSRMLIAGAKGINIPMVLVDYRITYDNYNRRRNWKNTSSFISVRWLNFRRGFSSFPDFLIPCAVQLFIFIMPIKLTGIIYKKFLRR